MIDYTRLGITIALSIPIGLALNELYCSIVALLRYILFEKEEEKMSDICDECMQGAPFDYCCKLECGEHYYCENCNSKAKQIVFECPDMDKEARENGTT